MKNMEQLKNIRMSAGDLEEAAWSGGQNTGLGNLLIPCSGLTLMFYTLLCHKVEKNKFLHKVSDNNNDEGF